MRKILLLAMIMVPMATSLAFAQADVLHLGWGACRTNGGAANQSDGCADDFAASAELIGSMNLGTAYSNFVAATSVVDAASATATLPDWWKMDPAGGCRAGSLSAASSLSGQGCGHPFGTQFNGIVQWFSEQANGPGTGRMIGGYARGGGALASVAAGTSFITFVYLIDFAHTTAGDPPQCTGCSVAMCFVYNELKLEDDPPATTRIISSGGAPDLHFVTWQNAPPPLCPQATPTRSATWGQVKSLYR